MPTLYERVLGDRYKELHPVLRAFHSQQNGAVADCQLDVIHPPGVLKRIFRKLAGMPSAGRHPNTLLEVRPQPYGEEWRRTIGGKLMATRQWQRGTLLLEGIGPAVFGIELTPDEGGLRFETSRFWMLGVPLARLISPCVSASVKPLETGWRVEVRLEAPILGTILIYKGEVMPHEKNP